MNCNPFTNGHKYLIETAASRCDFLYIFIVEEDRSFFPLKERLGLVREGTRHLGDTIAVIPSGNFIISMNTFGDYFSKDSIKTKIDPSRDVLIFGGIIAPALGIRRRFVGEEPFCKVTQQYNESMLGILPKLGIKVTVVQRKESGGILISASGVRKYLREDNFEAIRAIVPQVTYEYLYHEKESLLQKMKTVR